MHKIEWTEYTVGDTEVYQYNYKDYIFQIFDIGGGSWLILITNPNGMIIKSKGFNKLSLAKWYAKEYCKTLNNKTK